MRHCVVFQFVAPFKDAAEDRPAWREACLGIAGRLRHGWTAELPDQPAAADWAKRKGMGEAAIQHCRSYALEAERKMGQMLAAGIKAGMVRRQGRHPKSSGREELKLAEIGLKEKESMVAQALAALPRAVFDLVRNGEKTRTEVARELKRAEVVKRDGWTAVGHGLSDSSGVSEMTV